MSLKISPRDECFCKRETSRRVSGKVIVKRWGVFDGPQRINMLDSVNDFGVVFGSPVYDGATKIPGPEAQA